MPEKYHVEILKKGAKIWNEWRQAHPSLRPILRSANLKGLDFHGYDLVFRGGFGGGTDFRDSNLIGANLQGANLISSDLSGANLSNANCSGANFGGTDLSGAKLNGADFSKSTLGDFLGAEFRSAKLVGASANSVEGNYADFSDADLTGATFSHVDLQNTRLNGAIIKDATFSQCRVFGMAAWGLRGSPAKQSGLFVSPINADIRPPTGRDMAYRTDQYESALTVDSLEFASLFYSLVERERFTDLFNMLTSKVVLILGRFIEPRMAVLQAVRSQLADSDYLPVVFDFSVPWHRDLTETVSSLAHMSRFVVADLTDPKSIPQELSRIVPFLPSVPVVPIIETSETEAYAMFEHLARYPWVLELVKYSDSNNLLSQLESSIIKPAESFFEHGRR